MLFARAAVRAASRRLSRSSAASAPAAAAAAAAIAAAAGTVALQRAASCEADDDIRFQDLPAEYEEQRFLPARPYPAWDRNWDYCEPSDREVARALRHAWPIADYADAVRSLYAEHTNRSSERVERLLERTPEAELPALYRRAYLEHAYGGATAALSAALSSSSVSSLAPPRLPLAPASPRRHPHGPPLPPQARPPATSSSCGTASTTSRGLSRALSPALPACPTATLACRFSDLS